MEIEILRTIEEIEEIKEDWETIEKMNNNNIYLKYGFIKKWCQHTFDKNEKIFIIILKDNNKIIAIAPLYIEIRKIFIFTIRELKFIGNGDYKNILIDTNYKNTDTLYKKILDAIIVNNNLYDRIILEKINGNSNLSNYFLKDDRFNENFNFYSEIPILNLKLIRDKEEELLKPSKLNKYRNKLKRDYNYKLDIIQDLDEITYNNIINIHKKEQDYLNSKYKNEKRRSIFFLSKLDKFYKDYLVGNNKLIIFVLKTDKEEIINYRICYMDNETIFSWNTAYNIDFKDYRPNNILFMEIFEYLLKETKYSFFDFGAGRYPWKFKWTKDFNIVYNFESWNEKNWKIKMIKKLINIKNKF